MTDRLAIITKLEFELPMKDREVADHIVSRKAGGPFELPMRDRERERIGDWKEQASSSNSP